MDEPVDTNLVDATEPIRPCWHMRGLVNRMAEGSLGGFLLRYTQYHVHHCTRCRKAVQALKGLIARLRSSGKSGPVDLDETRWKSLENDWAAVENRALQAAEQGSPPGDG
jgi:hypothetical protein